MSPEVYFRDFEEVPEIEFFALDCCEGKILDVGAGVGAHALYLQDMDKDVTALEISTTFCEIMQKRGVQKIRNADIFHFHTDKRFDTLLFMMNGIGIPGTIEGLKSMLKKADELLKPDGSIVFDSSDVAYLWNEDRLSSLPYYGEVEYQYQYGDTWGPWFKWLYIDMETMREVAETCGWKLQIIYHDETDHYLGRLFKS